MGAAREYMRVVRQRWILVIVGLAVGLAAATAVTLATPTRYAATITMYIATPGQNNDVGLAYQGGLLSEQRATSYLRIMTSTRLGQQVVDQLGLKEPASAVVSRISASSEPFTVLISATVADSSPDRAAQIANAIGQVFPRMVAEFEKPVDPGVAPPVVARVLEPAATPAVPVAPRPSFNLLVGALLGLLAGFGLAVLRDALDTAVKSPKALADTARAVNLASVPLAETGHNHALILLKEPNSLRAEAYRQLRAGLQLTDRERARRVLVVASALLGEGTTTTLCNLATAFAQDGNRVLVVDTNLRHSRVADYVGLESRTGLTDVLAGLSALDQAIQPVENLFGVLPSGMAPTNAGELVASRDLERLLDQLRMRHDIVLLDSPPLLGAIDGTVLASRADGVLLVCRHGKTTRTQVETAVARIGSVQGLIVGTVLTMTPPARTADGEFYSYYAPDVAAGSPSRALRAGALAAAPDHHQLQHHKDDGPTHPGRAPVTSGQPVPVARRPQAAPVNGARPVRPR